MEGTGHGLAGVWGFVHREVQGSPEPVRSGTGRCLRYPDACLMTDTKQQLPKCKKCRKTIQLYRIVCILGEGKLACVGCANRLDLWDLLPARRRADA